MKLPEESLDFYLKLYEKMGDQVKYAFEEYYAKNMNKGSERYLIEKISRLNEKTTEILNRLEKKP